MLRTTGKNPTCTYCGITDVSQFRGGNKSKCILCVSAMGKIARGTASDTDPIIVRYSKYRNIDLDTFKSNTKYTTSTILIPNHIKSIDSKLTISEDTKVDTTVDTLNIPSVNRESGEEQEVVEDKDNNNDENTNTNLLQSVAYLRRRVDTDIPIVAEQSDEKLAYLIGEVSTINKKMEELLLENADLKAKNIVLEDTLNAVLKWGQDVDIKCQQLWDKITGVGSK